MELARLDRGARVVAAVQLPRAAVPHDHVAAAVLAATGSRPRSRGTRSGGPRRAPRGGAPSGRASRPSAPPSSRARRRSRAGSRSAGAGPGAAAPRSAGAPGAGAAPPRPPAPASGRSRACRGTGQRRPGSALVDGSTAPVLPAIGVRNARARTGGVVAWPDGRARRSASRMQDDLRDAMKARDRVAGRRAADHARRDRQRRGGAVRRPDRTSTVGRAPPRSRAASSRGRRRGDRRRASSRSCTPTRPCTAIGATPTARRPRGPDRDARGLPRLTGAPARRRSLGHDAPMRIGINGSSLIALGRPTSEIAAQAAAAEADGFSTYWAAQLAVPDALDRARRGGRRHEHHRARHRGHPDLAAPPADAGRRRP